MSKPAIKLMIFILLISLFSCTEEELEIATEKNQTSFIETEYTDDAIALYYNEISLDINHDNRNVQDLDTNEIIQVLNMIKAVHNLETDITDSIFHHYNIHTRYCNSLSTINMHVDTLNDPIINAINGIRPTGNTDFDEILEQYQFDSVSIGFNFTQYPQITLHSKNRHNLFAVYDELEALPFINSVDRISPCIGDGNNIKINRDEHVNKIVFVSGSGDCPSGCINHRSWEFDITTDPSTNELTAELVRSENFEISL